MNPLESELKRLPEPALPEGLTAAITARIERLDEERAAGAGEPPRVAGVVAGRDRLAWALALVGVTVGLGAQAYSLVVGEATLDLISPRISGAMNGVVAVLAVGLLLYLAGLFAPGTAR